MARELLLLRHGKSDWKTTQDDFHRPLQERGKRGAQRMGVWLPANDLVPDYVVSSPATRALETARKCCKAMGLRSKDVHQDRRIYEASPDALLSVLADCPITAQRVMLVGHNPGLEAFLIYLAAEQIDIPEDGKLLPTGTLARLSMPDDWSSLPSGCANLMQIIRPRTLPKTFPFPHSKGEEQRDRPAYYYTQSSVIPYRIKDGNLQILVVHSSSKRHWVVPKGIHDPGLTAQQSAAVEAFEEAGVEGTVMEEALGSYRYAKWGSECTVTVFGLQVERMIDEQHWEENHRGRKWLSVNEAIGFLKQQELGPLVEKLAKRIMG